MGVFIGTFAISDYIMNIDFDYYHWSRKYYISFNIFPTFMKERICTRTYSGHMDIHRDTIPLCVGPTESYRVQLSNDPTYSRKLEPGREAELGKNEC